MARNGARMVARTQESAQMNPTAVPEPLGWVYPTQFFLHPNYNQNSRSAAPGLPVHVSEYICCFMSRLCTPQDIVVETGRVELTVPTHLDGVSLPTPNLKLCVIQRSCLCGSAVPSMDRSSPGPPPRSPVRPRREAGLDPGRARTSRFSVFL